jgi:lipoate synthase
MRLIGPKDFKEFGRIEERAGYKSVASGLFMRSPFNADRIFNIHALNIPVSS